MCREKREEREERERRTIVNVFCSYVLTQSAESALIPLLRKSAMIAQYDQRRGEREKERVCVFLVFLKCFFFRSFVFF
jgi:hypothetical protein